MCTESQAYKDVKMKAPGLPHPQDTEWEDTREVGDGGLQVSETWLWLRLPIGRFSGALSEKMEVGMEKHHGCREGCGEGPVRSLQLPSGTAQARWSSHTDGSACGWRQPGASLFMTPGRTFRESRQGGCG